MTAAATRTPTARRGMSLAVLAGALGLDLSGLGVMNAALPSVGARFGLADATLQLTMTSYAVTFAGFLLFAGRTADALGHRLVFGTGVTVFTVAAVAGGLAPNVEVLIAARAVQGFGAALSGPAALALLAEVFPPGPARNRAMSVYASVGAASFSVGVVLGGVLTGWFGWRSVFLFTVAVGVVVLAGIGVALPPGTRRRRPLDLPGTALVTAGLLLAVFGVSNGGTAGWGDPVTVWSLVAAAVLLVAFVLWERHTAEPLLPLTIFRSTPVRVSLLAAFLNYTAGVGLLFFAPLYMQAMLGYPAAVSGLAVVPSSLILFVTANFLTGRLLGRWGSRPPMIIGLVLIGAAMAAWTLTPVDGDYWLHLLPGLLLTGVGQGLVFPAMTVGSLTGVPQHQHGVAGAINVTAQQIGSSVGVAVLVVVAALGATPGEQGVLAGYHAAYLTAAVLCLVGALVVASTRAGWNRSTDQVRTGGGMTVRKTELTTLDGVRLDVAVHHPAPGARRGTVVYAHGITADMDEFGMAIRVATELAQSGHAAVRFSFRGHGHSGGTQRGVTVAGEMLDLQAVVEHALAHLPRPLSVVASSFGAVSTLLSLPWLNDRLPRLVLLRPVLDLRRTFIEPETPWGRQHYSPEQRKLVNEQGYILVNGTFELGRILFQELRHHDPAAQFLASTVPALVVQGDQDSVVSYRIARDLAAQRPSCRLHTVTGADHGFADHEDDAVNATLAWLTDASLDPPS